MIRRRAFLFTEKELWSIIWVNTAEYAVGSFKACASLEIGFQKVYHPESEAWEGCLCIHKESVGKINTF